MTYKFKKNLALSAMLFLATAQAHAEIGQPTNFAEAYAVVETQEFETKLRAVSKQFKQAATISLLRATPSTSKLENLFKITSRSPQGDETDSLVAADLMLVKLVDTGNLPADRLTSLGEKLGGRLESFSRPGLYKLIFSDISIRSLTFALSASMGIDGITYVALDNIVYTQGGEVEIAPSDPDYPKQYHLHNVGQTGGTEDADIDAPEAWDLSTGSADVAIAVIDTGVDYNHSDLSMNIWTNPLETGLDASGNDKRINNIDDDGNGFVDDWHGWDFINGDNDPMDDNYHGTHVAGIISASTNNGTGVSGVSWKTRIVPLKFLNANGSGRLSHAIEAIDYATTLKLFATNNSWSGGGFNPALRDSIALNGTLFVAAAGNNGRDIDATPTYPASYDLPNILSVASSDHNDAKSSFSNYGLKSVDIAAPGSKILSTLPENRYGILSGTSMAAPVVAGIASLVNAHFPKSTLQEVITRVLNKGDRLANWKGVVASGARANAAASLRSTFSDIAPIGTVTAYFGTLAYIPDNWMLCDGRSVSDPDSPLVGQTIPDLRSRFVMGAGPQAPMGTTGGLIAAPLHSHQVSLTTDSVWFGRRSGNGYVNAYNPANKAASFDRSLRNLTAPNGASNPYDSHGHVGGKAFIGGATQGAGLHDNRPPFAALQFIIRVK